MARQPTPKKYHGASRSIYNVVPIDRPLAALIGSCVSASSNLEVQLSLCLGSILGVDNSASVAVFVSLKNASSRREAIRAAAEYGLGDDDRLILEVLMKTYERLDGIRNDIVHGIWGEIEGISDIVLWCSTKYYANFLIKDYQMNYSEDLGDFRREKWNNMFVWKLEDIASTVAEIESLAHCVGRFHGYLRYREHPAGKSSLDDLFNNQLFQKEREKIMYKHRDKK